VAAIFVGIPVDGNALVGECWPWMNQKVRFKNLVQKVIIRRHTHIIPTTSPGRLKWSTVKIYFRTFELF